jgi:hypothetical protein
MLVDRGVAEHGISFFIKWKLQKMRVHTFYFDTHLLRVEAM